MRLSLFSIASLALAPLAHGQNYEFPRGIPVKASEVEWYSQTDAHQGDGSTPGIHSRRYNISANRSELYGNPNLEFPWRTGGIDESPNAKGFTFFRRPPKRDITWWQEGGVIRWTYPEGWLFGEVLQVDGHTFEVRLMDKRDDRFRFRVFRPFGERSEVDKFIISEQVTRGRLRNPHPVEVIDETALVDEVELSEEGVNTVLSRPFRDVTDVVWAESESGLKCYAPTASQEGQIVPVAYQGGFLSSSSCLKCHSTTQRAASEFQPFRDWYNRVRGSTDGAFSLSIFDVACVSEEGISRGIMLDQRLIDVR
jgi:hypothetical protein